MITFNILNRMRCFVQYIERKGVEMEEEVYRLTPKAIFESALMQANLVEDMNDWRIKPAWTIFQLMMEQHGYVDNGGDE